MPRRPVPKRTRERTFDGCATCRARKVKCDGRKPICSSCVKRGVECSGFEAKIQYVFYDHETEGFLWPREHDAKQSSTSRRPLFSEEERAAMSSFIASSSRYRDVDDLLENAGRTKSATPGYCPFNVIEPEFGDSALEIYEDLQAHDKSTENTLVVPQIARSNSLLPDDFQFSHDIALEDCITAASGVYESAGTDLVRRQATDTEAVDWSWPARVANNQPVDLDDYTLLSPILSWNLAMSYDRTVPQQAFFLLDHYRQQMVRLFSPKGSHSPPWAVLHLPNALSTLSAIAVYRHVSSARMSLFYSLLAVSAFNLDRVNLSAAGLSNFWWKLGDSFQSLAHKEVKHEMMAELDGLRTSKYKDTLMALLSMVTISVVSGRQAEARSFLLDAEHYILLRGIEKPAKSRKVNLLHQIYLFLRIVEESTHIYSLPAPTDLRNINFYSDPVLRYAMFPSLRTQAALMGRNLDLLTDVLIDRELAGEVSDGLSLFEEIYGIPIQLISLLSKVTWLANEISLRNGSFEPGLGLGQDDLRAYARDLENSILSWSPRKRTATGADSEGDPIIMHHLILAIHNALIIYFYRRTYDLHARVLQTYVEKVASHLFAVEQQKLQANLIFNGIAWPGFVAATEALDPFLRHQLSTWLRNSAQTSGFRNFDTAANIAQQVWRSRDQGQIRVSWIDLVKQNQLSLVMT